MANQHRYINRTEGRTEARNNGDSSARKHIVHPPHNRAVQLVDLRRRARDGSVVVMPKIRRKKKRIYTSIRHEARTFPDIEQENRIRESRGHVGPCVPRV